MKTAAIIVDNYKLELYKKKLNENEFTTFREIPYINPRTGLNDVKCTVISLTFEEGRLNELHSLVNGLELYYKHNKS